MLRPNTPQCFHTNCNVVANKYSLISDLRASHQLFIEKLLPEIEHHLFLIYDQLQPLKALVWNAASKRFMTLRLRLTQHIQTEETLVFPFLLGQLSAEKAITAKAFMLHHEQLEEQLLLLIELIQNDFKSLETLMPYRILSEKLNLFAAMLLQHAEEEDMLFENALKD
jgi:hypothetical protein